MTLAGILLTSLACVGVRHAPAHYFAEAHVIFYPPTTPHDRNALGIPSAAAIDMASLVQLDVDPRPLAPRTATSVSLLGEGIYDGASVQLPNDGGQWAYNFDRPRLDVQVTGGSPSEVRRTMESLLLRIRNDSVARQAATGASADTFVRTTESPASVEVFRAEGSKLRASLATIVLGGVATWALQLLLTRVARRPPRRASAVGSVRA